MIERIVFILDSIYPAPLVECLSRYPSLARSGVCYPKNLQSSIIAGQYDQCLLGFLAQRGESALLRSHIQSALAVDGSTPRVLCLALRGYHSIPQRLRPLAEVCAKLFPRARQSAVLHAVRQDMVYEGMRTLVSMFSTYANPVLPWERRHCLRCTGQLLFLHELFGHEQVRVGTNPAACLRYLAEEVAQLPDVPAVSPLPLLPREVVYFANVANIDCTPDKFKAPGVFARWSTQVHNFTPKNGYKSDGHSLLGPKLRAEILAAYAGSNAAAAAMLGLERLFPDPEPEPDWEPWTGLTPDVAFRVAERLDAAFARELLAAFAAIPALEYQSREERIVHQALLEAAALSSGKPAPPRRLPPAPPKVAVLTPTYNHAAFIEDNIKSVIAQQTDFPIQHIIADDGSDDGTQDIILEYAAKYPHILPVFQRKRSHGPRNFRALFEMARSPYVALCDGDDYFTDPAKLQLQADLLDANPSCALCFHPARKVYEDGSGRPDEIYPVHAALPRGAKPFYYLADLLCSNLMQTGSVMYRWRFAKGLPDWFRTDLCPGDWYWHLLHAELGKMGFIDRVMSVYRRHKQSVFYSATLGPKAHRNKTGLKELEMYAELVRHFKDRNLTSVYNLANRIFADTLQYASETGDNANFERMVERYPVFAACFKLTAEEGYPDLVALFPDSVKKLTAAAPGRPGA